MIFAFARDGGLPASRCSRNVSRAPHPRRGDLVRLDRSRAVRLGRLDGHDARRFGLYDGRILHRDLPVLLFRNAYRLGLVATGGVDADGAMEHRRGGVQAGCRPVDHAAVLIFVIGVQPPNAWALTSRSACRAGALVWFALRETSVPGPADRRHDRQAAGGDRSGGTARGAGLISLAARFDILLCAG